MTTPPESQPKDDPTGALLSAPDQVLSTLNKDGTRRWLNPVLSAGRFWTRRRLVAYGLIAIFMAVPHLRIGGAPVLLLDVVHRQFVFGGFTFLATDTPLLMFLMLGIFAGIFLITALFGRAWCGWACPQTVYMEFVFRPLERLIEGKHPKAGPRRVVKFVVYLALAFVCANTFLAYFVGTDALRTWMTGSPTQHPVAFAVMGAVTLLMFGDFAYFREQTCLVACPYGRFQSVLLDRDSLIVGYDAARGEPRGKLKKRKDGDPEPAPKGDCIDCGACVRTCPTGIDIRDGLQMECVSCTQCIDACDAIMDRIGKPRGLVRYSSQNELTGTKSRIVRPRVVLYALLVTGLFSAFGVVLATRSPARVSVRRGKTPFLVLPNGEVQNVLRLKVQNNTAEPVEYRVTLEGIDGARLLLTPTPLEVGGRETGEAGLMVIAPVDQYPEGRREVTFVVTAELPEQGTFTDRVEYVLFGPKERTP